MNSLKLDIGLSLGLHAVVVIALIIAGSMSGIHRWSQGDVIHVSLKAGPIGKSALMMPASKPSAPAVEQPTPIASGAKALPGKKKTGVQPTKPKSKGVPRNEQAAYEAEMAQSEIQTDATAGGSPFAGATVDNPAFTYSYWFEQVFTKIQSNWVNYVATDGAIVCVVYFQVIRSGRLMEARVETPSGIPAFDQGCLAAVQKSAPFPPLPSEFQDEVIGITLPCKYQPR